MLEAGLKYRKIRLISGMTLPEDLVGFYLFLIFSFFNNNLFLTQMYILLAADAYIVISLSLLHE
jgi:hypothetical protein